MMKKIIKATFGIVTFACLLSANAEPNLEHGKQHFQICTTCHGENGEGKKLLNAPASAGQSNWYISRQLNNFREGVRGTHKEDIYGAQMKPMAMSLKDGKAIEDIAAYIGTLPIPTPTKTIEGDVEVGKRAYAVCIACHGTNAEGNASLNAPRLSRQHDWYIVRQMKIFKAGIRGSHADDTYGAQMKSMAQLLTTEEQIKDVAAYINTLD